MYRAYKTANQVNYAVKRQRACEHKRLRTDDQCLANLRIVERTICLDCGHYQDRTLPHRP